MQAPSESVRCSLQPVLSPYRAVLSTPGAARFSAAAALGRANISMDGLAIVFLVKAETGSYASAGAVAGVFGVAVAVAAPLIARSADTRGQRPVLRAVIPTRVVAMALLVIAVVAHAPLALILALAAPAGAATAQVGSMVRTRWTHALRAHPERLRTAYSWESVLDEVVFITGPLLVTVLATRVSPVAAIALALGSSTVGLAWFLRLRRTEPPIHDVHDAPVASDDTKGRPPVLRAPGVLPSVVTFVAFGAIFGSVEVVTVAFTDVRGAPASAGWLLAVWSAASMLAGLVFGVRPWPGSSQQHFAASTGALAVTLVALPFVGSIPVLALVLAVSGLAISPGLVAGTQWMQTLAPEGRTTEALTWTGTGIVLGAASGSALAGHLIESSGPSTAYWVTTVSALAAAALALATLKLLRPIPHLRPLP